MNTGQPASSSSTETHSEAYKLQCQERYKAMRAKAVELAQGYRAKKVKRSEITAWLDTLSDMNRRTFAKLINETAGIRGRR